MGMIINIDEALKLRSTYNVLLEPLNMMLTNQQEAWEKENPIDLIYNRGVLSSFQQTFVSSIGFDHAFKETSDYAVGPIFNTAEGFAATYTSRTFQGGFIITQQTIEDMNAGSVKDTATSFLRRWHGDIVEYAITALAGGFGEPVYWGDGAEQGRSKLQLFAADTQSGAIDDPLRTPLFSNKHTIVKREGKTYNFAAKTAMNTATDCQTNLYYVATEDLDLLGSDAGKIAKLADVINVVVTDMENYRDDNGKRAGVLGTKTIVSGNDAHMKAAINAALTLDMFCQGETSMPNAAQGRAEYKYSPYFMDIDATKGTNGFFIVDKAYNAANHGPEFTERIPLTLDAIETKRPKGITYDGRQRFDINTASWRGTAYVRLGTPGNTNNGWDKLANYTRIVPTSTIVKPVTVVGTVTTQS